MNQGVFWESLQNPTCLRVLNSVVKNTKPEYRGEILKASGLFRELRSYLQKYGRKSLVGQWASIILFSYDKLQIDLDVEEEDEHTLNLNSIVLHNSINDIKEANEKFDETGKLLRNVLREAVTWQNQLDNKNNFKPNIFKVNFNDNDQGNANMQNAYAGMQQPNGKRTVERQNNFISPIASEEEKYLSISFLLKESPQEKGFTKRNFNLKSDQFPNTRVGTSYNVPNLQHSYGCEVYDQLIQDNNDMTMLDFKPPFTSTPKRNTHSNVNTSFRNGRESLIRAMQRDHTLCNRSISSKSKLTNITATNKSLRKRFLGATFLDSLNESCKTFIRGLTSIFKSNKISDKYDDKSKNLVTETDSCAFSFADKNGSVSKRASEDLNYTISTKDFSLKNSSINSCSTCNDTLVLKQKLKNNIILQKTIRKLKLGINLYGCDFKKISRKMWPKETYMTPKVLYNLYRKLIMKQ